MDGGGVITTLFGKEIKDLLDLSGRILSDMTFVFSKQIY